MRRRRRADLLLACASGGHLFQLFSLREVWEGHSRVWVTERAPDAASLLHDEWLVYGHGPAERDPKKGVTVIAWRWLRNILLAFRLAATARPKVVLTTGGAVAVPFAWIGRLFGARVVYVESLTRIEGPSMCCKLVAPVADRVYVQWPELAASLPGSRYAGSLLALE
jgi:UDP-N-acetylglucosamine:LPS N-acetylglucosamine transferase